MRNSFPYRNRIIAVILLTIFLFSPFPSHTQTPVSTCNWKVRFCGPSHAPTNNVNFFLRLIHSLPTTGEECPAGQVINGFNEDGTIRCITNREERVDGQCGTTIKNTCTAGISNDTTDASLYHQWKCTGQHGGISRTCRKAKEPCASTGQLWTSGSNTCSATLSSVNSGGTAIATDSTGLAIGSATYTCNAGVWSLFSNSCQPNTLYGGKALSQCTGKRGRVVTVESSKKICKLSGSSCPSGWRQYGNYSTTQEDTCRGGCCGSCPRSCNTGSHSFSDKGRETCRYLSEWREVFWCKSNWVTCRATITEVGCY